MTTKDELIIIAENIQKYLTLSKEDREKIQDMIGHEGFLIANRK